MIFLVRIAGSAEQENIEADSVPLAAVEFLRKRGPIKTARLCVEHDNRFEFVEVREGVPLAPDKTPLPGAETLPQWRAEEELVSRVALRVSGNNVVLVSLAVLHLLAAVMWGCMAFFSSAAVRANGGSPDGFAPGQILFGFLALASIALSIPLFLSVGAAGKAEKNGNAGQLAKSLSCLMWYFRILVTSVLLFFILTLIVAVATPILSHHGV